MESNETPSSTPTSSEASVESTEVVDQSTEVNESAAPVETPKEGHSQTAA
jgi:hypothetical protein